MSDVETAATDPLVGSQEAAAELREQEIGAGTPRRSRRARRRPTPAQLSHQWRHERTDDFDRRRWLIALSLGAAALGKVVALYQVGLLRRLPDVPVRPFDASRVDASPAAYGLAQTPDGLLMAGSYLTTAILAATGGKNRVETDPILPLALAAKTAADLALGLVYTRIGWKDERALCGYCQTSTLISAVSLALAWPEARKAARQWRRGVNERSPRPQSSHGT